MSKKIFFLFAVIFFSFFYQTAHSAWISDEGWGMPVETFSTETDRVWFNVAGTSWPAEGLIWYDPDGLQADPGTLITRIYKYYRALHVGFYAFMEVKTMNRKPGTWHVLYGTELYPFEIVASAHMTVSPRQLQIVDEFSYPGSEPRGLAFDGTHLWIADMIDDVIYELNTSGVIMDSFDISHHGPEGLTYDGTNLWNVDYTSDSIYQFRKTLVGNIINSFPSPGFGPAGLAYDGTFLWNADWNDEKIYRIDTSGNVQDAFDSPSTWPTGLAHDGVDLWHADYDSQTIYRLDISERILDSPGPIPTGLTFDGTYLWITDDVYMGDKKIYKMERNGNVIDSFTAPGSSSYGLGGLTFDGTFLWQAHWTENKIYKLDLAGNIIDSFASPGAGPDGLAFDGTYLWNADWSDNKIYKMDTQGNVIDSFNSPGTFPRGLTFDGTYLWNADADDGMIYKLDMSGNIIDFFATPGTFPKDLAFDGTSLWHADSGDDKIYEFVILGALNTFTSPGPGPDGLAFDGIDLWNADDSEDTIYRLDTGGNVIDSFASPGAAPAGLAYDGTFLWNADGIDDKIYKLDTTGNILGSLSSPGRAPAGLAYDGTYLWNSDWIEEMIYQLEVTPSIEEVGTFDCPCGSQGTGCSPEGLAFDGSYFWHSNTAFYPYDDRIYKLDTSLNIVDNTIKRPEASDQFYVPLAFGYLAFDGTYLWNADWSHEKIFMQDTSGNIIDSYDSPGSGPGGIEYYGGSLWHVDWNEKKVYKLWRPSLADVGSSCRETFTISTDEITSSYGYNILEIQTISITGTNASEYSIQNDNCSGQSLAQTESCTFDLLFSPTTAGVKSAVMLIPSNHFPSPKQIPLSGKGVVGLCEDDDKRDSDVDGSDIAAFADSYGPGSDLASFAADFGRINCPY